MDHKMSIQRSKKLTRTRKWIQYLHSRLVQQTYAFLSQKYIKVCLDKEKMAQSTLSKVFVYGTLKKGQPNHYWLTEAARGLANFLTTGSTIKKYPLVIGTRYNIPFLLDKEGTGENIEGEVYEVDEKMIENLDILEDYPTYYDREIQDINTPKGILPCWVYIIRRFPEQMLLKKFLKNYTNSREQPYLERSHRDPNIKSKDDMNF